MKTTKKDVLEFIKGASEDDLRDIRYASSEAWVAMGRELQTSHDAYLGLADSYKRRVEECPDSLCLMGGLNIDGVTMHYIMLDEEGREKAIECIQERLSGLASEINEMLNETK